MLSEQDDAKQRSTTREAQRALRHAAFASTVELSQPATQVATAAAGSAAGSATGETPKRQRDGPSPLSPAVSTGLTPGVAAAAIRDTAPTERRHTWTANEGRVPVMPGANMYAAAIVVRTAVRRSSDEPHEPT